MMTYYKNKYDLKAEDYPNAVKLSNQSIAFPVGPHVSQNDIDYIAELFLQVIKEYEL